jgi:hypothetical protein
MPRKLPAPLTIAPLQRVIFEEITDPAEQAALGCRPGLKAAASVIEQIVATSVSSKQSHTSLAGQIYGSIRR